MLIIPKKITVQLVDESGKKLNLKNALLKIRTKAAQKNDIKLGPFCSNEHGLFAIERDEVLRNANEVYKSGLMDYAPIESSHSEVQISLIQKAEIQKRLKFLEQEIGTIEKNIEYLKSTLSKADFDFMFAKKEHLKKELSRELGIYQKAYNIDKEINAQSIIDKWEEKERIADYLLKVY